MEQPLEEGRFHSRWNAGESGGPAQTVRDLLETHAERHGHDPLALLEELANLSLADSPNHGRQDLREHVARLHPGATADNVLITTGTSEALFLLFLILRPQKVALVLPGFQLLSELVTASGAEIVPLPMLWDASGTPLVDTDRWLEILRTQKPDLIVFNHPHNPSGAVFEKEFLDALQDHVSRSGARLIGDEHYRFLYTEGPLGPTLYQPCEDVPEDSSTAGDGLPWRSARMVTGSFIKCLGTPGLRIGWCVAPAPLIVRLQNLKNYTTHTVNPVSEWLAERVLRHPDLVDFAPMQRTWRENRERLEAWSRRDHGWLVQAPQGGWVTCLSHREFPRTKASVSQTLQEDRCFLLDLEHLEWERFGAPECALSARGGFRLGLGMHPAAFGDLLDFLETL